MKFLIEESLSYPFGSPVKQVVLLKEAGQSFIQIAAGFKTREQAEMFAKEYKEHFKETEIEI